MQEINPDKVLATGESFEEFFEESLCGYILATGNGIITRANKTIATWLGCDPASIKGKRFSDLLAIGGKIYFETHLGPLLKMQGYFDEIAVEISCTNNTKLPVLVNALEVKDNQGKTQYAKFTLLKATDRRKYEQNLKEANATLESNLTNAQQVTVLREQLVAILGHDLRNPLGSIMAGASLLSEANLSENDEIILQIISRSAARMAELIENIMDFARSRLGEGIILDKKPTFMEPFLKQVVDELKTANPDRVLITDFRLPGMVMCDGHRVAQIFSNLLANAITHGAEDIPVEVKATTENGWFVVEVCNGGHPIPADLLNERLFEPFTRESTRPSRNGLGLGLFIASQIAKAHNGDIIATSDSKKTCFTFRMPVE